MVGLRVYYTRKPKYNIALFVKQCEPKVGSNSKL